MGHVPGELPWHLDQLCPTAASAGWSWSGCVSAVRASAWVSLVLERSFPNLQIRLNTSENTIKM